MTVPVFVTDVGTFLKRAECRTVTVTPDVGMDTGENTVISIVTVQMMCPAGCWMDSGEKGVINNVTVRMKDHVIRLTVYVQAVTAPLDVLLLVSLNEKVKCFSFKYFFSAKWLNIFVKMR